MDAQLAPIEALVDVGSDDDVIHHNQTMRRRLINRLTKEGSEIPEDRNQQVVLLTALSDADRTALQNKKIGVTEKMGAQDRQAAMMIARLSGSFGKNSPFKSDDADRTPPVIDVQRLPALELVPGETENAPVQETYEQFMERMDAQTGYIKPQ